MSERSVRPQVLGAARRDGAVLLAELVEPATGQRFRRLPGGGVRFGESTGAAVVREFHEELAERVEPAGYLGTVENRFRWDGDEHHDLAVVHAVRFHDDAVYDRETLHGVDADGTVEYEATWVPLADLGTGPVPLYPAGCEAVLRGERRHLYSPPE
jgi:ADP-ribose pyrophosphatase YjhB (NUDIX family)